MSAPSSSDSLRSVSGSSRVMWPGIGRGPLAADHLILSYPVTLVTNPKGDEDVIGLKED